MILVPVFSTVIVVVNLWCPFLPADEALKVSAGVVILLSALLIAAAVEKVITARRNRLLGELSVEVYQAILLKQDEETVFSTILDYAFRIVENAHTGSVLGLNEEGSLVIVASRGFDEAYVRQFEIRLEDSWQYRETGGSFTDAILATPKTIHQKGQEHHSGWEGRSVLSAPLYVGEKFYGFLSLDSYPRKSFRPFDLEIIRWFRAQIEVCLLARETYRTALADSQVDGLTKFLSRTAFDEVFAQTVEHANRYGETFTLGMFDVDNLKTTNDQFGHVAGDQLLRTIADAIRRAARKSDIVGRYGGDEFVAIFRRTNAQTMSDWAERLRENLRDAPPRFQETTLPASFSCGFADFPGNGRTFQELVAVADVRLYRMKAGQKLGPATE